MNSLPAGLIDQNMEFFSGPDGKAYCLRNGAVLPIDQLEPAALEMIEDAMEADPQKFAAVKFMANPGRMEMLNKFINCTAGSFDNVPDVVDGRLDFTEYVYCANRGSCAFEGVVCNSIHLTRRESEILRLIHLGYLDKEIAERLHISLCTVATHTRSIRNKTGVQRKAELSVFATKLNLI
jgi:DNA-binding CsgD family transcriptional regulator